jgi:hypothetical protein
MGGVDVDRYEAKLEQIQGLVTEVRDTIKQDRSRPLVVIGRRSGHEIAWLAYSIVGGVYLLFSPSDTVKVLAPWQVYTWAAMFIVSGAVGLWSILDRRDLGRSLGLEQGAWLVNAAALLTFAAVLISLVPIQRVGFTVGMCAIWISANLFRALWQIRQEFGSLRVKGADE